VIDRAFLRPFLGPFEWGVRDCVQFAAAAWERRTGENPAAGFSYSTEAEALALVDDAGSMEELVSSVIGEAGGAEALADAKDYDIVLTSFPGIGPMLGIASPPDLIVLSRDGFHLLDLRMGVRIWSCP